MSANMQVIHTEQHWLIQEYLLCCGYICDHREVIGRMCLLHIYVDLHNKLLLPLHPYFEGMFFGLHWHVWWCVLLMNCQYVLQYPFMQTFMSRHLLPSLDMERLAQRKEVSLGMSQNNCFVTGLFISEDNHSYITLVLIITQIKYATSPAGTEQSCMLLSHIAAISLQFIEIHLAYGIYMSVEQAVASS